MRSLRDKVVLITGGSKGLGLVIGKHLVKEKCKLALCARSEEELLKAKKQIQELGGEVFIDVCDVADEVAVKSFVENVITHYGKLDVVINDAGIMIVGPMESFTHEDYEAAMNVMYWGLVNTTLAALPHMKKRKEGQIINITSVGGKVSIPHMLPYSSAKFAAVGFSDGIAAELRKDNIYVSTIIPGLMRTGSYVNAFFQKNNKKEFKLFSFMSTAPILTISADRAAKLTIDAIKQKSAKKVLGLPAKVLIELNHFFPETTVRFFGFLSRILPGAHKKAAFEQGQDIRKKFRDPELPVFESIGKHAQAKHQPTVNLRS